MNRRIVLKDGTIVEAEAFKVPISVDYPEGIKYSFQHYDPETGKTVLRYDNYSKHSGSRHHKHLGERATRPENFESLQSHFKKFMKEVKLRGGKESP
ncbi:hypothetical protein AKJ39_05190 [candidate division MSBL1 archaeon SCGC-AAA259J03]|uniref:Uncharacterized protein n=1 Tax=candidate division MSBL1 archaeon SCGC-AAA259J03 TaxID=1698269 RepID=A0A656YWG3_9EURY|nr:hypothetical protein AKJ39_05190 [candidate division MSBL1 archaeon SCGC-AAA259J03]